MGCVYLLLQRNQYLHVVNIDLCMCQTSTTKAFSKLTVMLVEDFNILREAFVSSVDRLSFNLVQPGPVFTKLKLVFCI